MTKLIRKICYYITAYSGIYLTPNFVKTRYKKKCYLLLNNLKIKHEVFTRVNYYNSLHENFKIVNGYIDNDHNIKNHTNTADFRTLSQYKMSTYYFLDFAYILRFFNPENKITFTMGDANFVPQKESIAKSRPLYVDNKKSIILKLNKFRHFRFISSDAPFEEKISQLVWRGACYQKHRKYFLERTFKNPLCNVAQINHSEGYGFGKFMTIAEQLKYKFILCIEGADVATNLKWAMSSNSLVFMQKPKFETWFMEGILIPGKHYVELNSDYSNLDEQIQYYSKNIDAAEQIIRNAHQHVKLFLDKDKESLISMLVLEKYFHLSGQMRSQYEKNFT